MIQLANTNLLSPEPWVQELLDDVNLPLSDIRWWGNRSWPGFGSVGLGWPKVYEPLPRPRINSFRWYVTGASRWSYGHFLASSAQAQKIRNAAFNTDGTDNSTINMTWTSPGLASQETLTGDFWLLPPVPLVTLLPQGGKSVNGLYLLTVVDDRFFWWQAPMPELSINDATTWANVFSQLGSALDATISTGTISSNYLNPSIALNLTYEAILPCLDAACASVGHRLVYGLDGSVKTQPFSAAMKTANGDVSAHPKRTVVGGGSQYVNTL